MPRLQELEGTEDDSQGAQHTTPVEATLPPVPQSPVEDSYACARRSRQRAQSAEDDQSSVFSGLEGQILQVQRLQGKTMKAIQRQMVANNRNIKEMKEAIYSLNNTVAEGMEKMADAMRQICERMDSDCAERRRDRHQLAGYNRSVDRLCNATRAQPSLCWNPT